ncbi:MAG: LysM peptidoglycan-binding domain-containing protein, partial [Polyangiaceae bacterium]
TEQDPTKLEAFASAIAPTYPLSASALRQKAAMLRAGTLPKNPVDLLTQVPDPIRTQVMQQLMLQNDPNALEAYAAQLAAQYPAAAAALRMKEAVLRGQAPEVAPPTPGSDPVPPAVAPSAPVSPVPPAIPQAPPIAAPTIPLTPSAPTPFPSFPEIPLPSFIPPAPAPNVPATPTPAPLPAQPQPAIPAAPPATFLPGLDANMPPEMQKAVAGALTTESDPAKLEGFASAIQAQYPIASGLLKAKAEALRLMPQIAIPAAPPPAPAPIVLPSAPPLAPIATNGTYTVLPGDFPIKIAQKLVGNGNRWKELIAANPQKKTAPDGNFASLLPGEVLKLPASWTTPAPTVAPASALSSLNAILPNLAPALAALPAVLSLPPPVAPPSALPVTLSQPTSSGTYKVISGDNPSKIALKLTGNANRWKELVAANPQKKTGPDGNFTSLLPGETLHLPASWSGGAHAAHA